MKIEDRAIARMNELICEGYGLAGGNHHGHVRDEGHMHECIGWLAAAHNVVHLACGEGHPYRVACERWIKNTGSLIANQHVGAVVHVLERLVKDAGDGLLTTVADAARAETFDDFLDHAKHYLRNQKKNEAGTIAGVVFEDTVRRLRTMHGIDHNDSLDQLISALATKGVLTQTKAKRARAAADLRTRATHADWARFNDGDVDSAIRLTEELIELLDH